MQRFITLLSPIVILMIIFECNAQVIDIKKTTENVVINQTNMAINNGINRVSVQFLMRQAKSIEK